MAKSPPPKRAALPSDDSGPHVGKDGEPRVRSRARRWMVTGLKASAIVVLVMGLLSLGGVAYAYQQVSFPDPNVSFTANKSVVYYRDGTTQLGTFLEQNRTTIPLEQIPQTMQDAVVAAENRTFWTDKGISPSGIARSIWAIVTNGEIRGGGSTITQQYIKVLYLTQDQTASRKAKELLLAIKMGRELPKDQIMEGYLNTIYFGRGAYGVQAAAKAYFLVDAKDLTLEQSAALAAILNNPSMFDPSADPSNRDRLAGRYQYVLDGMLEQGTITQAQYQQASASLPEFPDVPVSNRFGGPKGFLLKMVETELINQGFTADQINGGGLRITTTFDVAAQQAAEESAQKWTDTAAGNAKTPQDPAQLHAAIASVSVGTGEVLALYGGPDYVTNSRNWATTPRMAASTFKTYGVIAGLQTGFSLKTQLNGNTFTPKGDTTVVRNEFGQQYGTVSLVKATADSINTAFVDLTQKMPDGPNEIIKAANSAGVPTGPGWDTNNRITLGTAEVSPLAQATGYATIANDGVYVPTHVVKEIKDLKGREVYKADFKPEFGFPADVARDTTFALQNVVNEGTGAKVSSLGRDIAGKTGTAGVDDDVLSSWFVAYTKQVSTAVMYVAGDAGTADLDPYARKGDQTFFGGTYPALTWLDYMKVATDGQEKLTFDKPAYVNGGQDTVRPTVYASPTEVTPTPEPTPEPSPTQAPSSSRPASPPPSSRPPSSRPPTSTATSTTQPTSTGTGPPPSTAPPSATATTS